MWAAASDGSVTWPAASLTCPKPTLVRREREHPGQAAVEVDKAAWRASAHKPRGRLQALRHKLQQRPNGSLWNSPVRLPPAGRAIPLHLGFRTELAQDLGRIG